MLVSYKRLFAVIMAFAALALVLAACGGDDNDSDATTTAAATAPADGTAAIALPEKYQGRTLVVATDASYAPNEFFDEQKRIVGTSIDLANALGEQLGTTVRVQNVTFDSIIPGLAAGRYDLGISSFTDTLEREKVVDFVTYLNAGTSFYVAADGGPSVGSLEDLCAKKVAVEKGTTQQDDAEAQAKKCKVDVQVFPDQNGVNTALGAGRADVAMADSPVAAYQVKLSEGKFKLTGSSYGVAPYGIAVPKDSGLAEPVLAGVKALIASGKYKEILDEWGVADGAIDNPVINGAID
jgi:polar amino acid transport system substrate-binding protein